MGVIIDDLMAPAGPLEPGFFPDSAVDRVKRLTGYLSRAKAKVDAFTPGTVPDVDGAVLNYTLYLAFEAAYLIKSNNPATTNLVALGLPSETFLKEQIQAFKQKAMEYLSAYEEMTPSTSTSTGPTQYDRGTYSVRTTFGLF